MDRISTLPNEIVSHILSFLSIKEAALTSLLSKRWRNRFAFAPDLHLCFVRYGFSKKNFTDFVDRVLAVSGNFPMRKFSLKVRQSVESSHIIRWIINVTSRGIVDLDLDTLISEVITLPSEIFICKTIVKLKLGSLVVIAKVPENASLPALKTLFLNCVWFSGHEVETLISACHVLEELTIRGDPWGLEQCRTVSCPTLERLTLRCNSHKEFKVSWRLTFDTPSLAYLQYSDYVADEYPIVNLGSLVEAQLTLDSMRPISESNPKNLIKGLRNVKILNLSSLETSEVFYSCAEAIPLLENLSRLSIVTEQRSCWKLVPLLLKMSPNLETLVIEGPLHFYDEYDEEESESVCECLYGYSFLLSCRVKVLEITKYSGTKAELDHMKRFLEKLPCLELVNIRACAEEKLPLLMLPGACKIQFKFFP